MASLNKAMIIGNLGADPELRYTASGQAVTTLSVATNERWKDKDGNEQDRTEWHKIVVWGKTAEHCGKYLTKGRTIYVEGRIQTRKYDDKEGVTRYSTEIVADRVTFLGGGGGGEGAEGEEGGGGGRSSGGGGGGGRSSGGGGGGGGRPSGGGGGGGGAAKGKGGFDDSFSEDDIPF
jgi:single-strand DNA-binding protein